MPDFSLTGLSALLKGRLSKSRYSPRIAAALRIAYRGHQGQYREQADPRAKPIPYIVHPVGVALIAADLFPEVELSDDFDDVIAACITHDVLEDTDISPYDLEHETSSRTLELVTALTKPSSATYASRDERNHAFLENIKQAGKTAAFIKICDNLHNLSRPEKTPLGLLKKTVEKSRQYLCLFDGVKLGEKVVARYKETLEETDQYISVARGESFSPTENNDLSSVLTYCNERTKKKVLEPHDVVDILKDVTLATDVQYISIQDFKTNILKGASKPDIHEISAGLRAITEGGEINVDDWSEENRHRIKNAARVIAINPKVFGGSGKILILLLNSKVPHWCALTSLTVVVSFLFERALLHDANQTSEVVGWLRANNLDLNPDLAIEANLDRTGVDALAQLLSSTAAARGVLDAKLLECFPQNMESRIERREVRTKEASSIVRKMVLRKMALEDVEDVVGYRFVVRNSVDKEKLTHYISENIRCSGLSDQQAPIVRSVATSRGYKAEHLLFATSLGQLLNHEVAIEIQIRTILDDAWARVSQTIDYKKNNVINNKNKKTLKRFREMIDEIEGNL